MTEFPIRKTYRDPHFRFHVHTNDARVLEMLESYLDFRDTEKRFEPFFEMHFRVRYFDRDGLSMDDKAVYQGFHAEGARFFAKVHEKSADIQADVEAMEASADLFTLRHDMGSLDFAFLQPCRLFLAYRGWAYVHGAYVQNAAHDFIVTGPSGTGKSSIAHTLGAQAGFFLQSDDEVFVHADRHDNYCLPFPTRAGFKNAALERDMLKAQADPTVYGIKRRFQLPRGEAHLRDVQARASVIFVPQYDEAATSLRLEALDKEQLAYDVAAFTIPMCNIQFWPKKRHEVSLTLITFIKRSEAFRLVYNDRLLKDLPGLVDARWGAGHGSAARRA